MDKIEFRKTEQPLSLSDINEFEKLIKGKLPEDFKNHYLKYNGGYPNANWSEGLELNIPFEFFLSIKYGENTIEKELLTLNNIGLDYEQKIIFATKDIRFNFYIDISQENYGKIFVRKPKYVKESKSYDIILGYWEYHCENFTQFLNGLNQINYKEK